MEHSIDSLPVWIFESDFESDDKNNGRMSKCDEKYGANIEWPSAHCSVPKCIWNFQTQIYFTDPIFTVSFFEQIMRNNIYSVSKIGGRFTNARTPVMIL